MGRQIPCWIIRHLNMRFIIRMAAMILLILKSTIFLPIMPSCRPSPVMIMVIGQIHPKPAHAALTTATRPALLKEGRARVIGLEPARGNTAPQASHATAGAVDLLVFAPARRG
jgi:hypothetical protein